MSNQFQIRESSIPGCFEVVPRVFEDERGYFVKTYHRDLYAELGLHMPFAEEFYTYSRQRVLRGLHFQTPPMQADKIVCCLHGSVLDVVVDIRVGSPTYGKHCFFDLSGKKGTMVYIPVGLAHGFYVVSPFAVLLYKTGQVYSPEHDTGIRWDSAGISWPDSHPIVSQRDQGFPVLSEFQSPFVFEPWRTETNSTKSG